MADRNSVIPNETNRKPRSLPLATNGVRTGTEFKNLMSAIMTDVIEGTMTPVVANAAVNAGGKLLKMVELQLKYGRPSGDDGQKVLYLCDDGPAPQEQIVALQKRKQELLAELAKLESQGA